MEILKKVQIILGILFEHKDEIMLIAVIIMTALNVIFNIFITKKYAPQINDNANKKEGIKNIFKRIKIVK